MKIGIAVSLGSILGLSIPGCTSGLKEQPQTPATCPTYYVYTPEQEKETLLELDRYKPEIPNVRHQMADYGRNRLQTVQCRKAAGL